MTLPLPRPFLSRPFAHRGLHDRTARRVENSPAAFEAAIAAGYGIEMDVQLTADGRAVVFHDATLDRLTAETGPVVDRTVEALGAIRLRDSEDTIPSLAAVLAQVGGRAPLLIELKDQTGELGDSDRRLERAVAADLTGYAGAVAVMSFNPSMIRTMAELAPQMPRGLTTDAFAPGAWPEVPEHRLDGLRRIDADAVGAAFVSHDHRDLAAPRIAALRAAGIAILTWTIRSPEEERAARRVADNITFEGYRPARP